MQPTDPSDAMPDFPWETLERAHTEIEQLFQPKGAHEALLRHWEEVHGVIDLQVVNQTFVDHTRNLIGMLNAKRFIPRDPARACDGLQQRAKYALDAADKFQQALRSEPMTEDATRVDELIQQLRASIEAVRACVAPFAAEQSAWRERTAERSNLPKHR